MKLEENVLELSKLASEQLKKNNYRQTLYYLNQALFTLKFFPANSSKDKLRALVYSNLGCYLRRLGKDSQALAYFEKIIDISYTTNIDSENLSSSYLNICAILSEKGDHNEAMKSALKACTIFRSSLGKVNMRTYVIAHHSLGLEFEHLASYEEALENLNHAIKTNIHHFGHSDSMSLTLKNCIDRIKKKLKTKNIIKEKFMPKNNGKRTSLSQNVNNYKVSSKRSKSNKRSLDENELNAFKLTYNYELPIFSYKKRESMSVNLPKTAFGRRRVSPILDKVPLVDEQVRIFSPRLHSPEFPDNKLNKSYIYSPNLDRSTRADTVRSSPQKVQKVRVSSKRHKDEERLAATIIQSW